MSLTINTNLSSLIAQSSLKSSTKGLNQAIERMTTGYKINHAKDNAANYAIATQLSTKIGAYSVAEENALMGLDMVQTASSSLSLIQDKLERLRALQVQASNGTYGDESKSAINSEANALVDEIQRLYSSTNYNGIDLLQRTENDLSGVPLAEGSKFINAVATRDTSAMTALASVDETTELSDGTYSISSVEELEKLAKMTNNHLVSAGDEFVLANDIDMSGITDWIQIGVYNRGDTSNNVSFKGTFDGNGYCIKNFSYDNTETSSIALFAHVTKTGKIKNLGMENVNLKAGTWVAPLVDALAGTDASVENCYATGNVTSVKGQAGGLVADQYAAATIKDCYTSMTISGVSTGGIASYAAKATMENCYSVSNVSGTKRAGGLIGHSNSANTVTINNCAVLGHSSDLTGIFLGAITDEDAIVNINNSVYSSFYEGLPYISLGNNMGTITCNNITTIDIQESDSIISLQVGINSNNSSVLDLSTSIDLNNVNMFRTIGLEPRPTGYDGTLDFLDEYLSRISTKQTELGAAQNRLESALDSISVSYDNIVSSRSTIQDADIADVSAEYLRQQILQQASATLMATANQSPAVALQLI